MSVNLSLSVLVSFSFGFFLIRTFLPLKRTVSAFLFLEVCLSIGLGFGITSMSCFLCLLSSGPGITGIFLTEAVMLFLLICIFFSCINKPRRLIDASDDRSTLHDVHLTRLLSVGFYIVVFLAFVNYINISFRVPNGGWDSWAIWNLHARYLYRGGDYWRDAFSTLLAPNHHPDYPLLLSLSVSRAWTYIGKETQAVPMLIAFLFTFSTVGTLYSVLTILRSKSQGILASLILMSTSIFIIIGTYQYADVPIGFFMLASIALFFLQERSPEIYSLSFLSGTMAGFAGWTKNEGLLFLSALFAARLLTISYKYKRKERVKYLFYFIVGSLPVLAVIIYFKLTLAPPSDLIQGQKFVELIGKLRDSARYVQILKAFLEGAFNTLPYVIFMLFYLVYMKLQVHDEIKISIVTVTIVLMFMLLGYFLIYLITPYDLSWHLKNSLPRLLIQLWPSILLIYFMIVHTPEEALAVRHLGKSEGLNNEET